MTPPALPVWRRLLRAVLPQRFRTWQHHVRHLDDYILLAKDEVVYGEDGLYTLHAAPFLRDAAFLRAYAKGEQTQSWHGSAVRWRAYVACWAAQQAARLPGDFIECGVNRGGLASAIVEYTGFAALLKRFYLVDNFTGLVPAYLNAEETANGLLARYAYYQDNSREHVVRTFADVPNVQVIAGDVPDILPAIPAAQVAFLSLDMNCTLPEIKAAEFFWDRLVPGGIILLDDYAQKVHSEQQRAFDAFARARGVSVFCLPSGQGMLLKPAPVS